MAKQYYNLNAEQLVTVNTQG